MLRNKIEFEFRLVNIPEKVYKTVHIEPPAVNLFSHFYPFRTIFDTVHAAPTVYLMHPSPELFIPHYIYSYSFHTSGSVLNCTLYSKRVKSSKTKPKDMRKYKL